MTADEFASSATTSQPATGTAGDSRTLAARIEHLFATVKRRDGKPYTNEEVVAAICASPGGPKISKQYLWQLRRGERENPTKNHLEALAAFFGVSPRYFFDDDLFDAIAEELELLRILSDAGVKNIAARMRGLSSDSLRNIAGIVETVRRIEGLDTAQDTATRRDQHGL
jgi:transcriptional regulator with XRE-family HTH domain